jgi:4-phytase/acid phosphatase
VTQIPRPMHGLPPSPPHHFMHHVLLIHSIRFRVLSGQGSFPRRQSRWPVILILLLATLTVSLAQPGGADLEFALIFSRHGVRSPTKPNSEYAQYAVQEWPTWPVRPGDLTPNGKKLMILLGAYYREYFTQEGLITGISVKDAKKTYFYADNAERTLMSAEGLAIGLLEKPVTIHAVEVGAIDPLFKPVQAHVGNSDRALAVATLNGRIGNDPAALAAAYNGQLCLLENILLEPSDDCVFVLPPGKVSVKDLPISISPGGEDSLVTFSGSIPSASTLAEIFILEYCEGFEQVGWGKLNPDLISRIAQLHTTYFDLRNRTPYIAQVQGSNLASHILATLTQAAQRMPVRGAIGRPSESLVFLVGHDDEIASLAGLLRFDWLLPGYQPNDTPPGGAMVFELRRGKQDRLYYVRVYYVCQTLDQMRQMTPLSLDVPPAVAPIFIPDGSSSTPGYDCELSVFEKLVLRAINPRFVTP